MIGIRPLRDLDPADVRRLDTGYSSPAHYVVRKTETAERTSIVLELAELDRPYVRTSSVLDTELVRYGGIVREGFSFAAYDDNEIVGMAIAEPRAWNRSLWVWEVLVKESLRRRGIGRQLMDALAAKAKAARLRVLVCETQNTNVPAIRFYRRVGFELDGIDLSYYTNEDVTSGEVAIFMKRKLGADGVPAPKP